MITRHSNVATLFVLALAAAIMCMVPAPAGAATITPCTATPPPDGPVTELDGAATVELKSAVRRQLRRAGVGVKLARPANDFTGRPTFPVDRVEYGPATSTIGLGGTLILRGKKSRQIRFRDLTVSVRSGVPGIVTARYGGGVKRLFLIRGGKVSRTAESGELYLTGARATLAAPAASAIRKGLGLTRLRAPKTGLVWGPFNLYALFKVTVPPPAPEVEVPPEPPVAVRPAGAIDIVSASVDWRVRESFIRYINAGEGVSPIDGAVAGTAEEIGGAPPLVYRFAFPFSSGWSDAATQSGLVRGSGGVVFRYCDHTINFAVSDPEIELDGDRSRLIFRIKGTDGTPFPDSRAVVVGLRLSEAESVTTVGKTTTYEHVPGFVPEGAGGIFADFYMPGADFGSLSISYSTP